MANNNWPIENTAEDYFRQTRKRIDRLERIASPIPVGDLLGPGMSSQAVNIMDWNDEIATFNGFYFSFVGAFNAPVVTVQPTNPDTGLPDYEQEPVTLPPMEWTGQVIAREDGTGMQQVWNTDTPDSMHFRVRNFWPNPEDPDAPVVFGEWQKFATPSGFVDGGDLAPPLQDGINDAIDNAEAARDALEAEKIRIDAELERIEGEMDAADEALNDRIDAIDDTFDDRPPHIYSTVPPGATANVEGTVWEMYDVWPAPAGGVAHLLQAWVGQGGTAWVEKDIAPVYIPKIDINTGTFNNLQAQRLLVTDLQDYVRDPSFDGIGTWAFSQGAGIANYSPRPGDRNGKFLNLDGATSNGGYSQAVEDGGFNVTAGETYRCSMLYRKASNATPTTGWLYLRFYFYDTNWAVMPSVGYYQEGVVALNSLPANDYTWRTLNFNVLVPDGVAHAQIFIIGNQLTSTTTMNVDDVHVKKRYGGELIVDGAVQAQHFTGTTFNGVVMTSALFQTHAAGGPGNASTPRGIKILSTDNGNFGSLVAYNGSGGLTFSMNGADGSIVMNGGILSGGSITGGTITGGMFRTAASGINRWEINSTTAANRISAFTAAGHQSIEAGLPTGGFTDPNLAGAMLIRGPDAQGTETSPRVELFSWYGYAGWQGWRKGVEIAAPYVRLSASSGGSDYGVYLSGNLTTVSATANVYLNSSNMFAKLSSSAAKYKEQIEDVEMGEYLDLLNAVRPRSFVYKEDHVPGGGRQVGLIADELDALGLTPWVVYEDGEVETVNYAQLVVPLIAAYQNLRARIEALEGAV